MKTYQHKIGSGVLEVAEWGTGSNTLIGIHGITGNHTHFQTLAEQLGDDYRFIAYDVRGRGNSAPADSPSTMAKHAEDVIALIESLGIQAPVLIGHSMGAFIAAAVASQYRNLSGIVLLDGAGVLTEADAAKLTPAFSRLDKTHASAEAYVEAVKPTYAAMGLPWTDSIETSARYEVGEVSPNVFKFKGSSTTIREDLESVLNYNHEQICTNIQCPVFLVSATGTMGPSPLYTEASYDLTRKLTPNLQYYASPSNHYTLLLSRQPELSKLIREFLQKSFASNTDK